MFRIHLVLLVISLGSVSNSVDDVVLIDGLDDIDTLCKKNICIRKCCDKNEFVVQENDTTICETFSSELSDTNLTYMYFKMFNMDLYDNNQHDLKVNKKLSDVFLMQPGKFNEIVDDNLTFAQVAFIGSDSGFNVYLSEGGSLYLEFPNAYARWTEVEKSNFCIDFDEEFNLKFWSYLNVNISENNRYYTAGILISSVFLTLVLLVYLVLPELQNLAGLVLMAYVVSLEAAFLLLAYLQLVDMESDTCVAITGASYFFFLSTFCWMSVMSYDIWWTFRGYAKSRIINRRGEHFKFGMYCIYAFGIPTLMTIGFITVNNMDLSQYPWIVTPQVPKFGCFLEEGQKFVYLYIPMLILIVCNWMFYLMTAFNIWRLVRGTAILNSAHRSQKNRLIVYLKLSVIMGINWLLEVVSFLTPNLSIWAYTDAYNVLIGFSIFLIFVWKKKIYRKLKTRFTSSAMVHKFYHSSMSSTLESNLGNEASSISTNPKGSVSKNL